MVQTLKKTNPGTLLPRWRSPFEVLRRDLGNLWDGFRDAGDGWDLFEGITPSLDLSEREKDFEVRIDLPGMSIEDIDIQVNTNHLTVSGERKEEKEERGKTYHRVERSSGSFSRMVTLPCEIIEENVEASYRAGVLTITLPKREGARSRRISIKG